MKKIISILFLSIVIFFGSCIPADEPIQYDINGRALPSKWKNGNYKDFAEMINDCKGVTIVTATSGGGYTIIARDSEHKVYTYVGISLNLQRGDTVKWK